MSLSNRLTELRRKHALLSEKIEKEHRMPGTPDLAITELKKEKLRLKEEIHRLEAH